VLEIEVLRDGKKRVLKVRLGKKAGLDDEPIASNDEEATVDGLSLAPLSREQRKKMRLSDDIKSGVLVVALERGSWAARSGLRTGDVIRELNRQPVKSVKAFKKAYGKANGAVAFLVQRGANTLYIALRKK